MFSEFKEAFKSSSELYAFLGVNSSFEDKTYPTLVSKSLAKKIKEKGPNSALWKQFVPDAMELDEPSDLGLYDPIADRVHSKGDGIIHRYNNRVLFTPTTVCPVNCRYCFRKNELSESDQILKGKLDSLLTYLEQNKEVEEVILTGGDPFMLSNTKLEFIIDRLKDKVKYLRFHSRVPVTMPNRFDRELINLLQEASSAFSLLSIAIHVNHIDEFDSENEELIRHLNKIGIQLLSQSVLLNEVNNSIEALKELYLKITELGVRPYYLHHPDRVKGAMSFYLPLEEGRKLYGQLRDTLPGWAIPHYVIDPENGQGKNLAYNPESLEYSGKMLDRFNQTSEIHR